MVVSAPLAACGGDSEPERTLEDLSAHAAALCLAWESALAPIDRPLPTDRPEMAVVADQLHDALQYSHPAYDDVPNPGTTSEYPDPTHADLLADWQDARGDLGDAVLDLRNDLDEGGLDPTDLAALLDRVSGDAAVSALSTLAGDQLGAADCDGLAPAAAFFDHLDTVYADAWAPFALTGDVPSDIAAACERHLDDVPILLGFASAVETVLAAAEIEAAYRDLAIDLSRIGSPDPDEAAALEQLVGATHRIAEVAGGVSRGGSGEAVTEQITIATDALETLDAAC